MHPVHDECALWTHINAYNSPNHLLGHFAAAFSSYCLLYNWPVSWISECRDICPRDLGIRADPIALVFSHSLCMRRLKIFSRSRLPKTFQSIDRLWRASSRVIWGSNLTCNQNHISNPCTRSNSGFHTSTYLFSISLKQPGRQGLLACLG